eukprot:9971-Eustigmatos_ZCMA.PRE.1
MFTGESGCIAGISTLTRQSKANKYMHMDFMLLRVYCLTVKQPSSPTRPYSTSRRHLLSRGSAKPAWPRVWPDMSSAAR